MQMPNVPDAVRQALDAFVGMARDAFGDDLRSIVLYGSAAEGRMRATSDVNLIVVLRQFDQSKVDRIREPFRFGNAAVGLTAMFVLDDEIAENVAANDGRPAFAKLRRGRPDVPYQRAIF